MKNLFLRGRTWYVRMVRDGKEIVKSTGTSDRKLAEKFRAKLEVDIWEGKNLNKRPSLTVQQAYDKALITKYHGSKSLTTVHINYNVMAEIVGRDTQLADITTDHYELIVSTLRKQGKAPGTINRKLVALSTLMTLGIKAGVIDRAPEVPLQVEPKGRIGTFTDADQASIMADLVAHDVDLGSIVAFLFETGARLSEALNLEHRDIDYKHNVLHLWDTKGVGGKMRSIPMTTKLVQLLQASQHLAKPFVLTKDAAEHRWTASRKRLGHAQDKWWVMHTIRHTVATRLIKAGHGLRQVQEWLGHEDIKTTERYTHVDVTDLRKLAGSLEQGVPDSVTTSGTIPVQD